MPEPGRNPVPGPAECCAVAVDVQPGLLRAYPRARAERVVDETRFALEVLRELGVPVVLLALDPDRLGPVHPEVRGAAPGVPVVDKAVYDATRETAFLDALGGLGRPRVLLLGIETHVCVLHTALGLMERGLGVAWLADATFSRRPRDQRVGERLLERSGAVPLTTETFLFHALGGRSHPAFGRILPLLKARVRRGRG